MIIIINGAINAGKSTVAKLLAKSIPNMANIEVDHLRAFVDDMNGPLTQELIEMSLINAAKVANTFHKQKIHSVISYPLLENDLKLLVDALDAKPEEIHIYTLYPRIDSLVVNRGERELADWEIKRTKELYDLIVRDDLFGNKVIDNTDQSPEETTKLIVKEIGL